MKLLWIGVAGAAGAVARWLLAGLVRAQPGAFPWATFTVNVTGSFALGLVLGLAGARLHLPDTARAALTVGFLGAYTTFSTFSVETLRLIEDGALGLALAYAGASVVLGVAAAYGGISLGRAL